MPTNEIPGRYSGPAGHAHDMSQYPNPNNHTRVPAQSGPTSAKGDIYFPKEFNVMASMQYPTRLWTQNMNLGMGHAFFDQACAGFFENNDVHGNSESELGSTPPNSVGLITHQGSQLGSSNSSVHANSIDLSVTEDQNANGQNLGEGENILAFAEWYSLGDEDSDGSRTFYTPASDAYYNEPQSPDTTAGALPYEQDANSIYPQDVTADGRIEPYGANRNLNRLADFEWRVSSSSTLSPVTYLDQRNNQDSPSPVLLREGLGYPRGQQINSNPPGAMKHYPRGQDMNAGYLAQDWLEPALRSQVPEQNMYSGNDQLITAPRRSQPATENGFGGITPRPQPILQYDDGFLAPTPALSTASGFGEPARHGKSQGADVHNSSVTPAALVNPNGIADQRAPFGYVDGRFIPLFKDENAFNKRKAAMEEKREISDYPSEDPTAISDILKRLYDAFRNTVGVKDSATVTAKFEGNSYSEEAYHEACWAVMIRCRDSQELKGLLIPDYHKTKFLAKETFAERMESVIETLRYSKLACKSVLAPSFLDRLADQPEIEGNRKLSNKKLNKNKTAQNKAGQKAILHNYADEEGVWKGPPVADAGEAGNKAEPQQAEILSGRGSRRKREDDEEAAPARKRARK